MVVAARDAVGEGRREQLAERVAVRNPARRPACTEPATPALGRLLDGGQRRAVRRYRHAGAATVAPGVQCGQPQAQVVAAGGLAPQRRARLQHGEQIGDERVALWRRGEHGRGQPRRRAQLQHAPTECGDAAVEIERAEGAQQLARLRQGAGWRRVEPAQAIDRAGDAPGGQLQREAGKFGLQHLRHARGLQPAALRPQPISNARRNPAGPPGALVGGGLRDRHRLQAAETAAGVETQLARESAVDHHADAGQGEAGLGEVGGEHHAAHAGCRRRQCQGLFGEREIAMQGHALDRGRRSGERALEQGPDAGDLAPAGQEHQHVAGMLGERLAHHPHQLLLERLLRARGWMHDVHRKGAAGAAQAGRREPARQTLAFEGGRHQHQAQVGTQGRLHVQRKREPEIGGERALVELVEQDRADAGEFRVVLQQAGQDALGDHLDAGVSAGARFETHAITDRSAHRLAERLGHEGGRRARGQPARLEDDDAAAGQPRLV